MPDKVLIHMKFVERSLNVSFGGGDERLATTSTLPFV
jgi:hypothetical protein